MDEQGAKRGFSFRDPLRVVFKRKWRFLAIAVLTPAAVAFGIYALPLPYEATGKLILTQAPSLTMPDFLTVPDPMRREAALNTETEILSSGTIAERVVDALGLDEPPPSANPLAEAAASVRQALVDAGLLDDADPRSRAISSLMKKVEIEVVPVTNVIQVRYLAEDPDRAADVVNAMMDTYLGRRLELLKAAGAHAFYREQAERLRQDLDDLRREERELSRDLPIGEGPSDGPVTDKEIQDLRLQLRNAEVRLVATREKIQMVRDFSSYIPFDDREGRYHILNEMGSTLLELDLERSRLSQTLRPDSPEITGLDKQLRELKPRIIHALEALGKSLETRIALLESQIAELEQARQDRIQRQARLGALASRIEFTEDSYEHYRSLEEEARLSETRSVDLSSVRVLDYAQPPRRPVFPRIVFILIGLAAGLVGATGFVLVCEYFDHRVDSAEQVEQLLGMRVLCVIPEIRGLRRFR